MSRFFTLPLVLLLAAGCAPKKIHALEEAVAQRDITINTLRAEQQGYVIQLDTLRQEVDRLGARNKELVDMYASITEEFGGDIELGNASLVIFPDRSLIAVGDGIQFASGSAALDPASDATLDRLASFLAQHPGRRFQVEGHTDAEPIHNAHFRSNWELGAARAVAVIDGLIERGVPSQQLSAATYGETAPIATNSHPLGMAANRRITVAVQTSVKESGAQQALLEAAQRAGGALYASTTTIEPGPMAALQP